MRDLTSCIFRGSPGSPLAFPASAGGGAGGLAAAFRERARPLASRATFFTFAIRLSSRVTPSTSSRGACRASPCRVGRLGLLQRLDVSGLLGRLDLPANPRILPVHTPRRDLLEEIPEDPVRLLELLFVGHQEGPRRRPDGRIIVRLEGLPEGPVSLRSGLAGHLVDPPEGLVVKVLRDQDRACRLHPPRLEQGRS